MEREKTPAPHPRAALAKAREAKGLQQADLADKFSVTQATVSHWETGAATPHPSKWSEIAEVYDLPLKRVVAMFTGAKAA